MAESQPIPPAKASPTPRYSLRRRIKWGAYHLLRWIVRVVGFVLVGFRVYGQRNIPRTGPLIVVANHLHNFDLIALDAAIPRPVFYMAKQELFERPFSAFIFRTGGGFPVKRGAIDRAALRHAGVLLDEGLAVGILPEGTRSLTRSLQLGSPGVALIAQGRDVPIVPVAVTGTERLPFDAKAQPERWWGGRTTVLIGKPFTLPKPRPGERADLHGATERIMLEIAALLPPEYRGVYAERLVARRDELTNRPGAS